MLICIGIRTGMRRSGIASLLWQRGGPGAAQAAGRGDQDRGGVGNSDRRPAGLHPGGPARRRRRGPRRPGRGRGMRMALSHERAPDRVHRRSGWVSGRPVARCPGARCNPAHASRRRPTEFGGPGRSAHAEAIPDADGAACSPRRCRGKAGGLLPGKSRPRRPLSGRCPAPGDVLPSLTGSVPSPMETSDAYI